MHRHFESKKEILEYVEKVLDGKGLWKVEIKADELWVKPMPEDKCIRRKLTGKITMIIEAWEQYEED